MKYFLLIYFIAIGFSYSANTDKKMSLKRINEEIRVDGIIEDAWSKADSVSDFFQLTPYTGKEPTRETIAKVLSTNHALYVLIVCYDERENIQANTGRHDNFAGDVVSIMLDTFGDKRTAYKFAVSASGSRSDCRLLDDARNRDYSWDGIWFSDTQIYDWGFVVEMEIPYKSIQYNEEISSWGLDFDRWITWKSEDIYWCEYERNEGQRISKFGELIFEDISPNIKGLNLELYPVAFGKIEYLGNGKYKVDPKAGLDLFYNPSPQLTIQATANPDFAQIEADPFNFNISRYETFFSERRPFFIQGNEIFMPSGKERGSGFYTPLQLFYSRRIGKSLPDGQEVPLIFGTKVFGRINDWEYGGFLAKTSEVEYMSFNDEIMNEPSAFFISGRVKKQILSNSNIGVLFVGKQTNDDTYGVIDIDGAFRGTDWQLSYQLARSIKNSEGDFGLSGAFMQITNTWLTFMRGNYIGDEFDVNQVGFVPWRGTSQLTLLTGPIWYPKEGKLSQIIIFMGGQGYYEKADEFIDYNALLGLNMQFKSNWGFEINLIGGKSKDNEVKYNSYEFSLSSWFNIDPQWNVNLNGGFSRTFNFSRDYLANYAWNGGSLSWNVIDILKIGTSLNIWFEWNPDNQLEDITYNSRPWISFTPINDLNFYFYLDNVFVKSSDKFEQFFFGGLFSYQFSPKSWIYFAINEIHDRNNEFRTMKMTDRISVFKIKYLYYF